MLGIERRIARYTWTVILIFLFVGFLYVIRQTLFIFIVALLFSYLLWPLVHLLERRLPGRSKIPSLTLVYLLLLSLIVGAGFEIGSRVAAQASALSSRFPEILSSLEKPIAAGAPHSIGVRILAEIQSQIAAHAQDFIVPISNAIVNVLTHAEIILFIVLVPILSFFFLKDGQVLLSSLLDNVVHSPRREVFNDIAGDLHLLLAQYMRALVLLGLAASLTYTAFFAVMRVPYALLLGVTAFFFEFVPLIGPLTSAFIILVVAGSNGYPHLLLIVVFIAAFRLFQDYILTPRLLSSGTELHPLLVIFGALAGAQLAGIPGAFLSVPVMATLRIVYRQVQKRNQPATLTPEP
jgi:predicted PurR-regulated permease PerM